MIIGIDASRANRDHKTGVEWYSYYLIKKLAQLDDKNQYILYTDKPLKGGLLDLSEQDDFFQSNQEIKYDKDGFQIIKSPFNNFKAKILNWPFDYLWTQGRLSLEMLFNRPDVLFIPAHVLPFIHPRKSIITIHDVGFKQESRLYKKEQMGPIGRKKALLNFFVRIFTWGKYSANTVDYLSWSTEYALKYASKIITVSNFTKSELQKYYKIKKVDKIKVIYNGYNVSLCKKITDQDKVDQVLNKYGIEKPYLFYVGRIERKKNIPALIEAFALMRESDKDIKHKLVLVGDASFGYDEVNYIIEEFDLDQDVIMTGWLEEEDLPCIYNGASAFVFPSNYEGFGIPILQAMACGVPVVASNVSSIPEVAGGAALLFDPCDIKSIAESMKRIIKDEKLKQELIEKGHQRVSNFSWEKCAQETLREINS